MADTYAFDEKGAQRVVRSVRYTEAMQGLTPPQTVNGSRQRYETRDFTFDCTIDPDDDTYVSVGKDRGDTDRENTRDLIIIYELDGSQTYLYFTAEETVQASANGYVYYQITYTSTWEAELVFDTALPAESAGVFIVPVAYVIWSDSRIVAIGNLLTTIPILHANFTHITGWTESGIRVLLIEDGVPSFVTIEYMLTKLTGYNDANLQSIGHDADSSTEPEWQDDGDCEES